MNGLDMLSFKHSSVVEMIHESSHVTLTLVGKMTPNGTKGGDTSIASCTVYDITVDTYVYRVSSNRVLLRIEVGPVERPGINHIF